MKSKSKKKKPITALTRVPRVALGRVTHEAQLSVSETIEKVLIQGDLSTLSPPERVDYYKKVCQSLGLNPLTQPFQYIIFEEMGVRKCVLYALKSCTEQLRKIHGVSIVPPFRKTMTDNIITCEVDVRDRTGRTDTASGSVPRFKIKDGKRSELEGREFCNADMKSETKAKRRATLSICGLAILDESELDGVNVIGGVTKDGRLYFHQGIEPEPQAGSAEAAQAVAERKKEAGLEGRKAEIAARSEQETAKTDASAPVEVVTGAKSDANEDFMKAIIQHGEQAAVIRLEAQMDGEIRDVAFKSAYTEIVKMGGKIDAKEPYTFTVKESDSQAFAMMLEKRFFDIEHVAAKPETITSPIIERTLEPLPLMDGFEKKRIVKIGPLTLSQDKTKEYFDVTLGDEVVRSFHPKLHALFGSQIGKDCTFSIRPGKGKYGPSFKAILNIGDLESDAVQASKAKD